MIDLENLPEDWEGLVKKIGLLKRHCFASVFEKYFDFQEKISESPEDSSKLQKKAIIQYRDQEIMLVYVKFLGNISIPARNVIVFISFQLCRGKE